MVPMHYLKKLLDWLEQAITHYIVPMLKSNEYIGVLLIILLFLIITLIQLRRNKPKNKVTKKEKTPNGFRNYKGDIWHPDGRRWNREKKRWENPDYKKEPAEEEEPSPTE